MAVGICGGTIVVAEFGSARELRTSGWLLPALTGVAPLLSVGTVISIVTFRDRPLDPV
jgi:hypothetical protein